VYRVDWRTGGEQIGKLPMKLHQPIGPLGPSPTSGSQWSDGRAGGECGAARSARHAASPSEPRRRAGDNKVGSSSPPPRQAKQLPNREGAAQKGNNRRGRWPRGPQLDVAADAERAVVAAVLGRRPKAERHPQVDIPQLAGCRPLDQRVVPPLPRDRPLRVLELFAGVGSATQALARLGYHVGGVVA
jgi:hypothetical protein